MIYHLIDWLDEFIDIPGQGLLRYISSRAMMASVLSMIFALIFGKKMIAWLQKKQIGETIRDLGLEGQLQKKGTPTMGGIIIIFATLFGVVLFADLTNIYTQLLILTTVWLGALGFADDYIKVFKHDKEGLSEKKKLAGQFAIGLIIALTVCFSPDIQTDKLVTTIPFVKAHEFDYSWLVPFKGQFGVYCTWGVYMLMIIFIILACSNGTNLTDGMDGLAAGTSAIVGVVIGIFAWLSGHIGNAEYLNIMYIPGTGEVMVFMASLVGALIGFLWYNSYPAQVFMGDTGSLAIGGIIGVAAILIRKELLLPV
ncbi:MAG: phospho-N-acetylmuramoyl-pentapeptide-transferase, partial [Bacteroidales bacterium]|nr:phospho-N-acetylmuramoyl-pentapeptide-transferase [Bacteroidales bacterium]